MAWDAVLFDLDDTLYSRADVFHRFVSALARSAIESGCKETQEEIVEKIRRWDAAEPPGMDSIRAREHLFGQIKEAYPWVTGTVDELIAEYKESMVEKMRPDPAAGAVLARLNTTGIRWGILTNGDEYQFRKIDRLGLDIPHDKVLPSDTVGLRKPDVKLFDLAIERFGMDRGAGILMVGDNEVTDIQGANSAGLATAWMALGREWRVKEYRPDIELPELGDLLKHL
jgi:HAD superfamily hydrolase (TIGR01549 family)